MNRSSCALLAFATMSGGCALDTAVGVREPTTAAPALQRIAARPTSSGALYSDASFRPLFEDRRARLVGDTLTVSINEKLSASTKSATSSSRSGSVAVDVPLIKGLPGKSFQGAGLEAESDNKFDGKGEASSNNVFSGTITATVVDVLPNGNLVVSGEKRLGVSRNTETLRFSGVVSPAHITAANVVSSTQVADARLEYKGGGSISEAQVIGWMARFFLTFLPF